MPSEGGNTVGGIAIGLNAAAKDGSISIGQQVQTGSTNIDCANQRGVTSVGTNSWSTGHMSSINGYGSNIVTDSNVTIPLGFFSSARMQGFGSTIYFI